MTHQTATRGDTRHTLLFDAGPEGSAWSRNAARLRADVAAVEHVHLSHWHRDHSGGLLEALHIITAAKEERRRLCHQQQQQQQPSSSIVAGTDAAATLIPPNRITVDLHPDRPAYRGMLTPTGAIVSLEADPTFEEIAAAAAPGVAAEVVVERHDTAHAILDGFFLSSGSIPRRTPYEKGIRGGLRFVPSPSSSPAGTITSSSSTTTTTTTDAGAGAWVSDEAIADERLVLCRLRGKGLVVFTGCSHAGVINVCRHAVELAGAAEPEPLYAVVGGFHLADNQPEKLARSLADLTALGPRVLMPGHCTGWRFKYMCEQAMPAVLAPSFCGTTYTLA